MPDMYNFSLYNFDMHSQFLYFNLFSAAQMSANTQSITTFKQTNVGAGGILNTNGTHITPNSIGKSSVPTTTPGAPTTTPGGPTTTPGSPTGMMGAATTTPGAPTGKPSVPTGMMGASNLTGMLGAANVVPGASAQSNITVSAPNASGKQAAFNVIQAGSVASVQDTTAAPNTTSIAPTAGPGTQGQAASLASNDPHNNASVIFGSCDFALRVKYYNSVCTDAYAVSYQSAPSNTASRVDDANAAANVAGIKEFNAVNSAFASSLAASGTTPMTTGSPTPEQIAAFKKAYAAVAAYIALRMPPLDASASKRASDALSKFVPKDATANAGTSAPISKNSTA